MKKRVVIANEWSSLREMLGLILTFEGDYEVVGEAASGLDAVSLCRLHRPNLVVLDLRLPELSTSEVVRRLHQDGSPTRSLVYSDGGCRSLILEVLRAKPHGFVGWSDPLAIVRGAIKAVAAGRGYFSPLATEILSGALGGDDGEISQREREVAQMMAEGVTSKGIATRLGISAKTVENHRARLMHKLQLHRVADVTRYAIAHGWISAD